VAIDVTVSRTAAICDEESIDARISVIAAVTACSSELTTVALRAASSACCTVRPATRSRVPLDPSSRPAVACIASAPACIRPTAARMHLPASDGCQQHGRQDDRARSRGDELKTQAATQPS
jgi:hypothetical protein